MREDTLGVSRDDVTALLAHCDRDTGAGVRDYAVLLLLALPDLCSAL